MHDEHDGSGATATRIAAIAFADCDYSFIIGIDGRPGMLVGTENLIRIYQVTESAKLAR
jgi:hypothetical protein